MGMAGAMDRKGMPASGSDYRLIWLRTGSGCGQEEDRRSLTTTLRNRCPSPIAEAPEISNTTKLIAIDSTTAIIVVSYPSTYWVPLTIHRRFALAGESCALVAPRS